MSMRKVWVRIARGKNSPVFHRAGITFTKEWLGVGVDEATASFLYAEQMLEVADVDPNPEAMPIVVEGAPILPLEDGINGVEVDLVSLGLDVPGGSTVRHAHSSLQMDDSAAKKKGKG